MYNVVPKGLKTEVMNRLSDMIIKLDLPFEYPCRVVYIDPKELEKKLQELPEIGSMAIYFDMLRDREITKRILKRLQKVFNTVIVVK